MTTMREQLSDARKRDLDKILSSAQRLAEKNLSGTDTATVFSASLEHRLSAIETWLLDDEQKKALTAHRRVDPLCGSGDVRNRIRRRISMQSAWG